ncbi:MAG: hypothetical protein Q9220_001265 [cf. Caloplaca sp. 1 TL-2023]
MRCSSYCVLYTLANLSSVILAERPIDVAAWRERAPASPQQEPMLNIPIPGFGGPKGNPAGEVTISDVIGNDRIINIFAGFTRDIDAISKRLDDDTQNTTVLAPLNSEIQKLPRKPWEDPKEYEVLGQGAYDGSAGEDRAHRNLRRFVEAHIIPTSPWKEGEKVKSIRGEELWWESKDGARMISKSALRDLLVLGAFTSAQEQTKTPAIAHAAKTAGNM